MNREGLSPDAKGLGILSVVLGILLSIIGVAVGVQGPVFGPAAAQSRRKGLQYLIFGFFAVVFAVVLSAAVSYFQAAIAGPAFILFVGMFASGVIAILVGIVAMLTGRNIAEVLNSRV